MSTTSSEKLEAVESKLEELEQDIQRLKSRLGMLDLTEEDLDAAVEQYMAVDESWPQPCEQAMDLLRIIRLVEATEGAKAKRAVAFSEIALFEQRHGVCHIQLPSVSARYLDLAKAGLVFLSKEVTRNLIAEAHRFNMVLPDLLCPTRQARIEYNRRDSESSG